MSWYLEVLKKYAVFTGRARRKEYWMFFLFNFIVSFLIGFVLGFARLPQSMIGIVADIYGFAILLPTIAVGIRRMHDSDRCGWWLICPFANIVFLFWKGTQGDNRFGPDPKES